MASGHRSPRPPCRSETSWRPSCCWRSAALLTEEQFLSWGWRIGFWLSVVIVAIGYYIRTRVTDAPIFLEVQKKVEQEEHVRYGVLEVLRRYPRGVFTAMGLRFAENIMYYLVVTFSITYLVVNEVDTAEILGYMVIAHIVHMIVIPLIGGLADRIGRKPVYFIGAVLAGTWGFFAFPMFDTKTPAIILLAICIGLVIHAFMYASQPAIMSEMFPTRMRYSGVSLGYQVTSIVAGSLAPIIAAALLQRFDSWVPVAIYLAIAAAITLVAVISLRETKGSSLHELDRLDDERLAEDADAAPVRA